MLKVHTGITVRSNMVGNAHNWCTVYCTDLISTFTIFIIIKIYMYNLYIHKYTPDTNRIQEL
jgi:hypothetical protein